MKWSSTHYAERLNIANGFIKADIHYNRGYILNVNSKTFVIFNSAEEAKKAAEEYIRNSLNMAIKEVNL